MAPGLVDEGQPGQGGLEALRSRLEAEVGRAGLPGGEFAPAACMTEPGLARAGGDEAGDEGASLGGVPLLGVNPIELLGAWALGRPDA
ncbi:MAG TPA: hypothetical protein PKD86_03525 [Gemmatales bacterium]|nr:hypothetical protein [Gemmatales bacterium]